MTNTTSLIMPDSRVDLPASPSLDKEGVFRHAPIGFGTSRVPASVPTR